MRILTVLRIAAIAAFVSLPAACNEPLSPQELSVSKQRTRSTQTQPAETQVKKGKPR